MTNQEIFEEACQYIPGGVNSPVRAFKSVGEIPVFAKKGDKAHLFGEDGVEYIDYICSWGPLILGHNHPVVQNAIIEASQLGTSFGLPTKLEVAMAKLIVDSYQGIEMVRMVNSGTEATMSAIKLARGYTKKNKIIKFAGCYHGHFDGFLVEAGSGVLTEGIAGSLGIPQDSIKNTLIGVYNDAEQVRGLFEAYGDDIAAVIIEPVAGNMGVIKADNEFMETLRVLCDEYGALLVFDEVMSGFRVAFKGAQELFNVSPDLITYAKIMGGGLPAGVYGGRKEIMENLSPLGGVYQAGTMSGNPIVMSAGLATLNILKSKPEIYDKINYLGQMLQKGVESIASENNINVVVNRFGGMMTIFFTDKDTVRTYEDAKSCNLEMFKKYFLCMNKNGINIPQSQFEALFLSSEHNEDHVKKFLSAFKEFAENEFIVSI